jgi:hypothetical protein
MSDYKRTTSFSKTIDEEYQQTVIERNLRLTESFERSAAERAIPAQDRRFDRTQGGSRAAVPQPHLRPQGRVRRQVDRQFDNESRAREHARALAVRNERLREAERDRERDRDYGEWSR